jgi:hypothetical protein
MTDMADGQQTGGMIALVPSADSIDRLAVDHPDAEARDDLHMTLAYLGDDVMGQLTAEQREAVLADVGKAAAALAPIDADAMSHSIFNPNGDHDRKPCAVYLVVGDRLGDAREAMAAHDRSEHPMWLPHVTAGYGLGTEALDYTGPVTFDRLRVALADDVHDFPLTGVETDVPTEPDADDTEFKISSDELAAALGLLGDDVEVKAKVASKEGERRYGKPIGTELGQARDERGKEAQADPRSKELYDDFVNADPRQQRAMLDGLSAADLKSLSAITYSFRSSNPDVVRSRIAIAGALRRSGLDVNDFGGLGKTATPKSRGKATGRAPTKGKGKAKATASTSSARKGSALANSIKGNSVDANRLTDAQVAQLQKEGWKGRPGDGREALYRPGTKSLRADGHDELMFDDAAPADVEVKARTTTKPWETRRAQRGGKTIGAAKSNEKGGGDEYPVKTIGDIAAGVKRAKSIKDPERRKEVLTHLRAGARKIGGPAVNMVPKDDGGDSGKSGASSGNPFAKGKGKSGKKSVVDIDELSDSDLADLIEAKVMSPNPNAVRLREYWAHGEGRAKWRPGTPGDFERLRRAVRKYIPAHMLNGFVANVHKLATGEWPGKHAHGGKSIAHDLPDLQWKTISVGELSEAASLASPTAIGTDALDMGGDDDAVTLALDAYSDMADGLATEDAYEQALADQVDWELTADGLLEETEVDDPLRDQPAFPQRDEPPAEDADAGPDAIVDTLSDLFA